MTIIWVTVKNTGHKPMKRLRKWFISLMLIVITLIVLKMAFEIWWIPDYQGGKGYIGCSPDGRYKAITAYTATNGAGAGAAQIILEQNHSSPVSIIRLPLESSSTGRFTWSCDNNLTCVEYTEFQATYGIMTFLPPSLWQRLHAWLTVKIRGLENPNFIEENYKYDHRFYKNSQTACERYWND